MPMQHPNNPPASPLLSSLRETIYRADTKEFRSLLNHHQGWPRDTPWIDYELLTIAINLGRRRIVEALLQKGCRVAKDGCVIDTFHNVVRLDWVDVVQKFLERGARVYDQDFVGNTAVHVAFYYRVSNRMIELLIERYVQETSFNVENNEGLSIWHVMCAKSSCDVVKRALESGFADVNSRVPLTSKIRTAGYTALHFAVEHKRLETVKYLLESNANIYARDATGSTPLHLACKLRDVDMVDLLFSYDKMNENLENNFGLSHFMVACLGSNVSLVNDFLATADSQSWTCPKALVNTRVKEIQNYPVAGYTPLHFAAESGRYETVEVLLSYDPPCCIINAAKLTAATLANKMKRQSVFLALMRYCSYSRKYGRKSAGCKFEQRSQPYPVTVRSESDGYQVPDAWFSRLDYPQEYPRYVVINGRWGKNVIPLYAPKPGVQYDTAVKFTFNDKVQVHSYFVL